MNIDATQQAIFTFDASGLLTFLNAIYNEQEIDPAEKATLVGAVMLRAKQIGADGELKKIVKAHEDADREQRLLAARQRAEAKAQSSNWFLSLDGRGNALPTVSNFLEIFHHDSFYENVYYNVVSNCPERHFNAAGQEHVIRWSDADDARSQKYIEETYGIYNSAKHAQALCAFFDERSYNPIKELVDSLVWDGTERCKYFLRDWAKADDDAYTEEVSRLIFAGGIHRLYNPGCKFDDVAVFIGTKQGEGKSTLIRWLALNDAYFGEVKTIEGQAASEQLEGAWVCEIAELMAVTKSKEQEAVKAFITRQFEKYRKPYAKHVSELPRRCIFIGTTNNRTFLRDKTGNRRWYPVVVHCNGYDLSAHEAECREYIAQCWAEAKAKFGTPEVQNFARRELLEEYQRHQNEAMEDDWREGAIASYLESKSVGDYVWVKKLKVYALSLSIDRAQLPDRKESIEIGQIMQKQTDWEFVGVVKTKEDGAQRCWRKKKATLAEIPADETAELPF